MSSRPAWSTRARSRTGSKATEKPCLENPIKKKKRLTDAWLPDACISCFLWVRDFQAQHIPGIFTSVRPWARHFKRLVTLADKICSLGSQAAPPLLSDSYLLQRLLEFINRLAHLSLPLQTHSSDNACPKTAVGLWPDSTPPEES